MTTKRDSDNTTADSDATKFLEEAQRSVDFTFAPTVVLPGDDVTAALTKTARRVKLGACGRVLSACTRLHWYSHSCG